MASGKSMIGRGISSLRFTGKHSKLILLLDKSLYRAGNNYYHLSQ